MLSINRLFGFNQRRNLLEQKMHMALLFILMMFGVKGFSQSTVVCVSQEQGQPIDGVKIYDCKKQLKAISNEKGMFDASGICFPIFAKRYGFEDAKIFEKKDTIALSQQYYELSGVTVKPTNKMDLYDAVVAKSSDEVKKNEGVRYGQYFQAIMILNKTIGDTVYLDRNCLLAIKSENKKKSKEYSFYSEGESQSCSDLTYFLSDTASINGMLNIMPSFESNLKYDLVKTKMYALKFDENEISYVDSSRSGLKFERTEESSEKVFTAYFEDEKLVYWSSDFKLERPYENQNMFMNIDRTQKTICFDTNRYELNEVFNKMELTFFTKGNLYKLFMVQGFKENPQNKFDCSEELNDLRKHFQSIPYCESSPKYYLFE